MAFCLAQLGLRLQPNTRRLRIFHSYFWCVETQILPLSVSPWQSLREISRLYKVFGLSNFINRAVLDSNLLQLFQSFALQDFSVAEPAKAANAYL
jgi:hypothetical protein